MTKHWDCCLLAYDSSLGIFCNKIVHDECFIARLFAIMDVINVCVRVILRILGSGNVTEMRHFNPISSAGINGGD